MELTGSLEAHLDALEEPRVERTKRHDLLGTVILALCGMIGGAGS